MSDFDLYDDLELLHAQEKQKAVEDLQWKQKYEVALGTIERLQAEKKDLNKKIKQLEINFASLFDTARTEIKRKDNQIAQLRREKDDICFRRNVRPVKNDSVDDVRSGGVHFNPFAIETQNLAPKAADRPAEKKPVASTSSQRNVESERKGSRSHYRETVSRNDHGRDRSNPSRDGYRPRNERNYDNRYDRDLSQTGSSDSSRGKCQKTYPPRIEHGNDKHSNGTADRYDSQKKDHQSKDKRQLNKETKKDVPWESRNENVKPIDDQPKVKRIENKVNNDIQKIATLEEDILKDVKEFKKHKQAKVKEPKRVEDPLAVATEKSNQFLDALFDDLEMNDEGSSNNVFNLDDESRVDACLNVKCVPKKNTGKIVTKTDENCNVELQLQTPLKQSVTTLFDELFGPSPVVTTSITRRNSLTSIGESSNDSLMFKQNKKEESNDFIPISASKTFIVADLNGNGSSGSNGGDEKKDESHKKLDEVVSQANPVITSEKAFKFVELDSSFYSSEDEDGNGKEIAIQSQSDIESPAFENCVVPSMPSDCFRNHTEKNSENVVNGHYHPRIDSKNDKITSVQSCKRIDVITSREKHNPDAILKDQTRKLPHTDEQRESHSSRHTSERNEKKDDRSRKDSNHSSKHHKNSSTSTGAGSKSSSDKNAHRSERYRNESNRKHHHHKSKHDHRLNEKTETEKNSSSHRRSHSSRRHSNASRHHSNRDRKDERKDKSSSDARREKDSVERKKDRCTPTLIWSESTEENTVKPPSLHDDNSSDLKLYQDQVISLNCDDISDEEDGEVIVSESGQQKTNNVGLVEISDEEEVDVVMKQSATKEKQPTNESLEEISNEEEVEDLHKQSLEEDREGDKQQMTGKKSEEEGRGVEEISTRAEQHAKECLGEECMVSSKEDTQRTKGGEQDKHEHESRLDVEEQKNHNVEDKTSRHGHLSNGIQNEQKSDKCVVEVAPFGSRDFEENEAEATNQEDHVEASTNDENATSSRTTECVPTSADLEELFKPINRNEVAVNEWMELNGADSDEPPSSTTNDNLRLNEEEVKIPIFADKSEPIRTIIGEESLKFINDNQAESEDKEKLSVTVEPIQSSELKDVSANVSESQIDAKVSEKSEMFAEDVPVMAARNKSEKAESVADIEDASTLTNCAKPEKGCVEPFNPVDNEYVKSNVNHEKSSDCRPDVDEPSKFEVADVIECKDKREKSLELVPAVQSPNLTGAPTNVPKPRINANGELSEKTEDVTSNSVRVVPFKSPVHPSEGEVLSQETDEQITKDVPTFSALVSSVEKYEHKPHSTCLPTAVPQPATHREEPVPSGRRRKLKTPRKCTDDGKDSYTLISIVSGRYAKSDDGRSSISNKQPEPQSPQLRRTQSSSDLASTGGEGDGEEKLKPVDSNDEGQIPISTEEAKDLVNPLDCETDIRLQTVVSTVLTTEVSGGARAIQLSDKVAEREEMPVLCFEENSRDALSVVNPFKTICELNLEENKTEMSQKGTENELKKERLPHESIISEGVNLNAESIASDTGMKRKRKQISTGTDDEVDEAAMVNKIHHKKRIIQSSIGATDTNAASVQQSAVPDETCVKESEREKADLSSIDCVVPHLPGTGVPEPIVKTDSKKRHTNKIMYSASAPSSAKEVNDSLALLPASIPTSNASAPLESIVKSEHKKTRSKIVDNVELIPTSCKIEGSSHITASIATESTITTDRNPNHVDVECLVTSRNSPLKSSAAPKLFAPRDNKKKRSKISGTTFLESFATSSKSLETSPVKTSVVPDEIVTSDFNDLIVSSLPAEPIAASDNKRKAKGVQNSLGSGDEDEPLATASDDGNIHHKKRLLQQSTANDYTGTDGSCIKDSSSGNKKRHTKKVAGNSIDAEIPGSGVKGHLLPEPIRSRSKKKHKNNSPGSHVKATAVTSKDGNNIEHKQIITNLPQFDNKISPHPETVTISGNKKKSTTIAVPQSLDSNVPKISVESRDDNKSQLHFDPNDSVVSSCESHSNKKYRKRILQTFTDSNMAVVTSNEQILQPYTGSDVVCPIVVDKKKRQKKKTSQHSPASEAKHCTELAAGAKDQIFQGAQEPTTSHTKKKYKKCTDSEVNPYPSENKDFDYKYPESLDTKRSLILSIKKLKSPIKASAYNDTPVNKLQITIGSTNSCSYNGNTFSGQPSGNDQNVIDSKNEPNEVQKVEVQSSKLAYPQPDSITSSTSTQNQNLKESPLQNKRECNAIYIKRKMKPTKQATEKKKKQKLDKQPPSTNECDKPSSEKSNDPTTKRKRSSSHDKSLPNTSADTPAHHKIFNDDVFSNDHQATLPPVYNANEDDVEYQEIDNRMRSMFQSPTYPQHTSGGCSFDVANSSAVELQDYNLQENLTNDETLNQSETSLCDTSTSSRKISVGSNDYVIETVGAHTANVFITRKKCKKRIKTAVATA